MSTPLLDTVRAAHRVGICIVPPKQDGTKAPDAPTWKRWQSQRPPIDQVMAWYDGGDRSGVGFVCGAISGNLELLEFDDFPSYTTFKRAGTEAGLGGLIERIEDGYLEASPGGGIHWLWRCGQIGGNATLARRPGPPDARGRPSAETLIQTRGEGGYVVVAPSNGRVHPTGGAYRLLAGGVETIAAITPEEREALFELARSFDRMPRPTVMIPKATDGGRWEVSPGDDFNERGDWEGDVLRLAGWTFAYERNGRRHFRRPEKAQGVSGNIKDDLLYVFTSSTPLAPDKAYTKFGAFALLFTGGDFGAAAKELAARGYGKPLPRVAPRADLRPHRSLCSQDDAPARPGWPTLHADALHGPAGEFVRAVAPHTEADPAALLINFLVAFGSAAGRASAASVGSTRHGLNEMALIVGTTSRGRKDTARDEMLEFYRRVDPVWAGERVLSGLSTGEGLINAVRDALGEDDQGEADKRLLLAESEFTSVLKVANREGNTLSEILRQSWDGRTLRTLTRTNPLRASDPHISIVAGVTLDGLTRHLTEAEVANGFANRFLFILARRSRLLDQGGDPKAIIAATARLVRPVHDALVWARQPRTVRRDRAAADLWSRVYRLLAENEVGGLVGALTARAEAHLLRLSCLYAALDRSEIVTEAHLRAAIGVWRYSEGSVDHIFGAATGSTLADRIVDALTAAPNGLNRRALHRRFGNHVGADELNAALKTLIESGRIHEETVKTGGRPATVYQPTEPAAAPDDDPWDTVMGCEQSEPSEQASDGRGPA